MVDATVVWPATVGGGAGPSATDVVDDVGLGLVAEVTGSTGADAPALQAATASAANTSADSCAGRRIVVRFTAPFNQARPRVVR